MTQEELRMKRGQVAMSLEDELTLNEQSKSAKLKNEDIKAPEETIPNEGKNKDTKKEKAELKKIAVLPPEPEKPEDKKPEKEVVEKAKDKEKDSEIPWPKKTWGNIFVTFINEYNESTDLITTETNLRFLGVGGEYNKKYLTLVKYGYQLKGKVGLPIFKDEYKVPYSHTLRGHYFLSDILNRFAFYAGGEHSTLYSVNIPIFGEGLQLVDSSIIWAFAGIDCYFNDEKIKLNYEYGSSLGVSNKINRTFQATRNQFSAWAQPFGNFGIGATAIFIDAAGDFSVSAQNYELSVTYTL